MCPKQSRRTRIALIAALGITACLLAGAAPAAATAPETVEASSLDGSIVYAGQQFNVTASPDDFPNANVTQSDLDRIYLVEVTRGPSGDIQSIDNTIPFTNQSATYGAPGAPGDAFYHNIAIKDNESYALATSTSVGSAGFIDFAVSTSNPDLSWGTDTVSSDDSAQLSLDAERTRPYNVTIWAEGLSDEQLIELFNQSAAIVRPHGNADIDAVPMEPLGFDSAWDSDTPDSVTEDFRDQGYVSFAVDPSGGYRSIDFTANFSRLAQGEGLPEDGEYTFHAMINDETAEATADLKIRTVSADATIKNTVTVDDQNVLQEPAGDFAEITVQLDGTETAFMQLGGREAAFADVLYLDDDNGDGTVQFIVNTRLLGTDHTNATGLPRLDANAVYYSDEDRVKSLIHDEIIEGDPLPDQSYDFYLDRSTDKDDLTSGATNTERFISYLTEIGALDQDEVSASPAPRDALNQLPRPAQSGDYSLIVAKDGEFATTDTGPSTATNRLTVGALNLFDPGVHDTTIFTAPQTDVSEFNTVSDLESAVTKVSNPVALDDFIAVKYNATGLYGALGAEYYNIQQDYDGFRNDRLSPRYLAKVAAADDAVVRDLWSAEGITVDIRGSADAANPGDNPLQYTQNAEDIGLIIENGGFYVLIDTSGEAFTDELDPGRQFKAGLTLAHEDSNEQVTFADRSGASGPAVEGIEDPDGEYYPQFTPGESDTTAASVRIQEPSASFAVASENTIILPPNDQTTINGSTNLAPGTDAQLNIYDDTSEDGYVYTSPVSIDSDGSFATTLDTSDQSINEDVTVEFTADGVPIETRTGVFGETKAVAQPFVPNVTVDVPATAAPGADVTVAVTAENTGGAKGTATWTVSRGTTQLGQQTTTLGRGERTAVSQTLTLDDTTDGDTVTIKSTYGNATAKGTITIVDPTANQTEDTGQTDDNAQQSTENTTEPARDTQSNGGMLPVPGFGFPAAIGALVITALLARKHN